jgi:putative DNA primase/helicase
LQHLQSATPDIPEGLHDRAADNWFPLCAIAHVAGGEWAERAKQAIAALEVLDEGEEDNVAIILLSDIQGIFAMREEMPTKALLAKLHTMEDRPWPEWGKQRNPLSARQLADLLSPFGVRPKTIRVGPKSGPASTPKGYAKNSFIDVFARYLPEQAATPPHASDDTDVRGKPIRHTGRSVADENTRNPTPDNGCGGVADKTGGRGEKMQFSPNAPCPQKGCIGRLKLITGNAVMCGVCYWQPDAPAATGDECEDREEWAL